MTAADKLPARQIDVEAIDSIIKAAYDVISGPAGQERDWNRERSLFIPGARLIPTAFKPGITSGADGLAPQVLDVDDYIERTREFFAKNGFFEKEVARRTEQFGHIAHVWSTYESRHHEEDAEPFMRGINSIQLFFDGKRWWILTIYWQHESPEEPIPEEYLPNERS
jgi:hypothetical protein